MQLYYTQLDKQLKKKTLFPFYLVSGNEAFLKQMACDAIRSAVKEKGFTGRKVFYADSNFDWLSFKKDSQHYELFSKKQLLELHLFQSLTEAAAETLKQYVSNPSPDKIMLIITGKLDKRIQQSAWFKYIHQSGLFIPIEPIPSTQLTLWIINRFHSMGLKAEKEAIDYLISATEGNLLATAQTIEKLSLYLGSNKKIITITTMLQALQDEAYFQPFQLTEAALQGQSHRCLRILHRLKEEGIEPLLILWALSRECRQLASLAFGLSKGSTLKTLFREQHIWEKHQLSLEKALQRHPSAHWYKLLKLAADIDHLIKGIETGNTWDALEKLSLGIAGAQIR